jgi:RNA polymerase sigma-70 factor (sigma-E family)
MNGTTTASPHIVVTAGGRTIVEPESFEQLFEAHHDHLVRLAGLLTGSEEQAQDIVADVFARLLWRPLATTIDDPAAYLRRCVVNQVHSVGRRITRRALLGARLDRGSTSLPPFDGSVTERDRVASALMKLPARQRAVLVLRHFEDLSEAQTAAVLGIPAGTVKSASARGAAALRDLLREDHR